jgi:uncharacterized membrane protein
MSRHTYVPAGRALAGVLALAALAAPLRAQGWVKPGFRGSSYGAQAVVGSDVNGGPGRSYATMSKTLDAFSASAWGGVPGGDLHAVVTTRPTSTPSCKPYLGCKWGTRASASIYDEITVRTGPAGDVRIPWSFNIEGTRDNGRYNGYTVVEASWYFGTSTDEWMNPLTRVLAPGSRSYSGELHLNTGLPSATYYFFMAIAVHAWNGATADYSHTMRFDWDLPPGVTYTSKSGQFMADVPPQTTTPEPASLALVAGGLAPLVALARRRRRRRGLAG